MRIYFSGVGGVGIGPLMEIARDAGYDVVGSDREANLMTEQLVAAGLPVQIGQDGSQIAAAHAERPIDWFVYTSALPADHPELKFAREHGIRSSKRDEFLAALLRDKNLKLIAVAGTHGKTTITGMLIWAFRQLGIPLSYSVGSSLPFAPSGAFDPVSEYFVYECDEYDRNFLHFSPFISVITALDYDHPDTYPTRADYQSAFVQFIEQSDFVVLWEKDLRELARPDIAASYEAYDELMDLSRFTLAGDHNRHNAYLVERVLERIVSGGHDRILQAINSFPGTGRRFEKLADNLYSDYGHHPVEIAATLQMARELSDHVVLIYQPHQNIRQHEIKDEYKSCMVLAEQIYWLPTYLTRENPALEVLTPDQLIADLTNAAGAEAAEMNDELWRAIESHRAAGHLVLIMGAGTIDGWAREELAG